MNILTLDNVAFNLVNLPDDLTEEVQYSVLDNSDPSHADFYFMPLIFLESFNSPAIVLKIGTGTVTMPIDWSIAIGDGQSACDIEILPLTSLNDRGFEALCFNPLTSFRTEFKKIEILNFYSDVKWHFPKMKLGQLLSVPLYNSSNPLCAFFIKDVNKQFDIINLANLI